jgi:hypothetical protein
VLVSEDTHEAAGPVGQVELGERRLHWLKNVTEPVAARLAAEADCAEESGIRRLLCGFKSGMTPLGGTA